MAQNISVYDPAFQEGAQFTNANQNLASLSITTALLNDLAVTAGKIAADAVTTAKILDANVTNPKVADTTGAGQLAISKIAVVKYSFAVDGGTAGTITLSGSPTIPDKAVVWVESYRVLTTATSAADTATIALQLPTDGALTTAIAINDGSNPWDAGAFVMGQGGLVSPLPKTTTAARVPSLLVATQNLTAGIIEFQLRYWVSA